MHALLFGREVLLDIKLLYYWVECSKSIKIQTGSLILVHCVPKLNHSIIHFKCAVKQTSVKGVRMDADIQSVVW